MATRNNKVKLDVRVMKEQQEEFEFTLEDSDSADMYLTMIERDGCSEVIFTVGGDGTYSVNHDALESMGLRYKDEKIDYNSSQVDHW
jgi:hypothetical protein